MELVRLVDGDRVAGAVNRLHWIVGRDRDGHGHFFQRAGTEALGVEGIHVVHQAVIDIQHLLVFDLDAALVARRDGEHVGADGVGADVLQQGRITPLAHDIIVDAPRLLRLQELRLDRLAVDPHGEVAHGGALWQREHVRALHHRLPFVDE